MNKYEDPSLNDGFIQVYQCEKPFKLDNKIKSFEDTFMARIFKSPHSYKIQLTSENNVSFLYKCLISPAKCSQIAAQNSIQLQYSGLIEWLRPIFQEDLTYQFIIISKTQGNLKVIKSQKFKNYELAALPFQLGSDEEIRQNIMFRYQRMKVRKQLLNDYWNKMQNIIKTKNPSLLIAMESSRKNKPIFK